MNSNGISIPLPEELQEIKDYINSVYNPHNIFFEYIDFPVLCDNCQYEDSEGWGRTNPVWNYADFQGCLWGRLVENHHGASGYADVSLGRFYSIIDNFNVSHELGHALGLSHTFDKFSATNNSINERIIQDGSNGCDCNCKTTGDFICDTQVDPYIIGNNPWNLTMFNSVNKLFSSITSNSPTMHRVSYFEPPTCLLDPNATNVHYESTNFTVTNTGSYTFKVEDGARSGYTYIYENTFDPLSPCANLKATNGENDITTTLNAGVNYIIVYAGKYNNSTGNYYITAESSVGLVESTRFTIPGITNGDNISDYCGNLYSNSNLNAELIFTNIMSYHSGYAGNNNFSCSQGQASFIKIYNQGKPWEGSSNNSGGTMSAGFVVNQPMIISSPLNLTGNIEISAQLKVINTSISFMNGAKIIIKPGGELILDNGHLNLYNGMACIPPAEKWNGIKVLEPGIAKITLKNGSTISGASTAIESKGATLLAFIRSGSRINSYFGTALDIDGGHGKIEVSGGSILNGTISIKNFYSGIEISSSRVNIPTQPPTSLSDQGKIEIHNASFLVRNNSTIFGQIDIENFGSQTVSLRNSFFYFGAKISNSKSKVIIRDNSFIYPSDNLVIFNLKDCDIYNNTFSGPGGIIADGYSDASSLVFYNKFHNSAYSFKNNAIASNARLECNTMIGQGTRDWHFLEPVALIQGLPTLAAGNSFSRTANLEVNYLSGPQIRYYFKEQGTEEPINISGNFTKFKINQDAASACSIPYPNTPPVPDHCKNFIKDGDETGIDCGGSCQPCFSVPPVIGHCTNGVQDAGETGIDCGGPDCTPCNACNDGIQNNGESGIDCGGPQCPPCPQSPHSCTDGIMNGNETGIDCGGPSCPPCPTGDPVLHCNDGIQNLDETGIDCGGVHCPPCQTLASHCANGVMDGDETGVDCGGSCQACPVYPPSCYNGIQDGNETGIDCGGSCQPCVVVYPPSCYNGIKDGNETGIDCGGSCQPCNTYPEGGSNMGKYSKGDHSAFIARLNEIYGSAFISSDKYKVSQDFAAHKATLDGGLSCDLQTYITQNSATQPNKVFEKLEALSPNLSANAIHILFANSQYYTSAQVANVLKLNPAVITDRYIAYILYKTATFSAVQKADILAAAANSSPRTNTEILLSYKKQYQDAIIRDNIAMLSLNTPLDFNAYRAEIATGPDPYKVFEIAQSYADQGRHDLATVALAGADLCEITDPLYLNQLNGLAALYGNWNNLQTSESSSRNNSMQQYLTKEHGIASDLAADITNEPVKLKDRWQYEPLIFANPTSTDELENMDIDVYPNPANDVLNVYIKGNIANTNNIIGNVLNSEGKMVSISNLNKEVNNLDISSLTSGIYTLQVMNQNQVIFVKKFIKIK